MILCTSRQNAEVTALAGKAHVSERLMHVRRSRVYSAKDTL